MIRMVSAFIFIFSLAVSYAWAVEVTGTFEEAKAAAARYDKPLLVDFFTEW